MRWPTPTLWSVFLARGALLVLLWIVVYGGADFLAVQHAYRVRLHFDFELQIPLWPQFAAVYLSLFPMLWLSPFVLHEEDQLRQFATSLGWLIAISGIGFVLMPSIPAYDPPVVTGRSQAVFGLADYLNLDFNMLPSLHVGMAVLCAATYSRGTGRTAMVCFWTWAIAISASTLVTHQHHIADVVTGAALAVCVNHVTARLYF